MTLDLQRKSIAYRLWHAMLFSDRGRLISCIEACRGVWQYAWHHRRGYLLAEWRRKRRKVIELTQINQIFMILRVLRANIVGSATAPRLCKVGCVRLSPHSRLRRQCGVMQVVTAPRLMSLEIKWLYIILRLVCRGVWQYARQVSRR